MEFVCKTVTGKRARSSAQRERADKDAELAFCVEADDARYDASVTKCPPRNFPVSRLLQPPPTVPVNKDHDLFSTMTSAADQAAAIAAAVLL